PDGTLTDRQSNPVEFSLVTSAGNTERAGMAAIIQDDLKQLGITVHVVTLELRALIDRLLTTHDYDACVLSLGGGDANPNAEMNVWLSSGGMHVWHPAQPRPATPWEAEVDALMRRQVVTLDGAERKTLLQPGLQLAAGHLT